MGRVPFIGAQMVHLMLAGSIIAGETLSSLFLFARFRRARDDHRTVKFAPAVGADQQGSTIPTPGKVVVKDTYETQYEEMIEKTGVPFVPNVIGKDLIFSGLLVIAITTCRLVFGPQGPSGPPSPTLIHTAPKQISTSCPFFRRCHCCRRIWKRSFFSYCR